MNLELPFDVPSSDQLDEFLARMDDELDALFLDEVEATLGQLEADRRAPPAQADGAAA